MRYIVSHRSREVSCQASTLTGSCIRSAKDSSSAAADSLSIIGFVAAVVVVVVFVVIGVVNGFVGLIGFERCATSLASASNATTPLISAATAIMLAMRSAECFIMLCAMCYARAR